MMAHGGVKVQLHLFLTSIADISGQLHASVSLFQRKNNQYALKRGLDELCSRSRRSDEERQRENKKPYPYWVSHHDSSIANSIMESLQ
jgi:hypothetical protein